MRCARRRKSRVRIHGSVLPGAGPRQRVFRPAPGARFCRHGALGLVAGFPARARREGARNLGCPNPLGRAPGLPFPPARPAQVLGLGEPGSEIGHGGSIKRSGQTFGPSGGPRCLAERGNPHARPRRLSRRLGPGVWPGWPGRSAGWGGAEAWAARTAEMKTHAVRPDALPTRSAWAILVPPPPPVFLHRRDELAWRIAVARRRDALAW